MTPFLTKLHDYSRPLIKEEVLVSLINRASLYDDLAERMSEAAEQYGFTFQDETHQLGERYPQGVLIKHAIIVDGLNDPSLVTQQYRGYFSCCTSATLAISYSDEQAFALAGSAIVKLKQEYGPRLNFLRPCLDSGRYIPSQDKLVDNSICDSVRIKYRPLKQSASALLPIPDTVRQFFLQASDLIKSYSLYHRSPTDGFISLRGPSGAFYITSTKTSKIDLDLHRIAIVQNYDRESNVLQYSGPFLPSSDSVEASMIYRRLPWVTAILHTHASSQFTRNPRYRHKIAVPPARYGEAQLGELIAAFVEQTGQRDFVIMDDHGELFFSAASDEISALHEIKHTLKQELDYPRDDTK